MKKTLYAIILTLILYAPVCAETTYLQITPIEAISTHFDEVEVGDTLEFSAVEAVFQNDELLINKGQIVLGKVDFIKPNGWLGDPAEIIIKKFNTKTIDGKILTIDTKLTLDGNKSRNSEFKEGVATLPRLLYILTFWIRGSEVGLLPNSAVFSIEIP